MEIDFFTLWRWLLAVVVTVYSLIIITQTLWSYGVWLSSGDRYTAILRRYLVVQSLRLRLRAFAADLAVCGLLCGALLLLGWLHVLGMGGHL
jgi:hypothetical protein